MVKMVKRISTVKIIFLSYLFLYLISLFLIKKMDRLIYVYSVLNIDYFLWHISMLNSWTSTVYYSAFIVCFVLLFPIVSLVIPEWDKVFKLNGAVYAIPISLHNNKTLSRNMQSKLFWYHCFAENNIKTPKVYSHFIDNKFVKINEMENSEYYIIKPNYGTQGKDIKKIKMDELPHHLYNDLLLQEYVYDCFTDKARHFRINTISFNNVYIFSVDERKQTNDKIASNHANGATVTFCNNNNCDFLSDIEQEYIKDVSDKLIQLHGTKFTKIPFIGWDVCLTCNGPYLFEGNLGADIDHNYDQYIHTMDEIYNGV